MNAKFALGFLVGGLVGLVIGQRQRGSDGGPASGASNSSWFRTSVGTDGFSRARILKPRMIGRSFQWKRMGDAPAAGSRFEIRLKDRAIDSPLIPAIPAGTDEIRAGVRRDEKPGTVYEYGLYQVLADGRERCLHDPELEIGQI